MRRDQPSSRRILLRRFVLPALVLVAPALRAQSGQLTATPARPAPGAIVRLTLRLPAASDTIVALTGALAGEPLHFRRSPDSAWRAFGGIPVDAERRLVASAVV